MSVVTVFQSGMRMIFGSRNERMVKAFRRRVERVNQLEPQIRAMTDEQLRNRAAALHAEVAQGKPMREAVYEALAIMRESLDRNVGIRNIFNPEHRAQFDPSRLPAHVQPLYHQTLATMDATPPANVLGSEVPVHGYLQHDIPLEIYAAVRELYPESRPPFRTRPFDVQIIGAITLFEGKIAEMKTGEGKTIVAPLACFAAAVGGMQCHVVTVNDYLVQRDRDWVFPAFHRLGMAVGAIHPYHMQPPQNKQQAYMCHVVYGTNSEFGFDYLRDNMKLDVREQVQRRRDFCIVDEIDSILIDEARTPLIISGPAHDDAPQYMKANAVAEQLVALQKQANARTLQMLQTEGFIRDRAAEMRVPEQQIEKIVSKFRDLGADYIDEKEAGQINHTQYYAVRREQKQAHMTPLGVEHAQKLVGTRFYVVGNDMAWDHLINSALRAHAVYERDREYVVQNGEVVIVDEFTGRLMIGRQWSDGLHQAVEAKESRHGVKIKQETQTLATITIQNFFKLYKRLAGMTGTAVTESTEFHEIYGLDVVVIPTNVPVVRADHDDLVFITEKAKWNAILDEIVKTAEVGRPVLVGTTSVEKSELLSTLLTKKHGLEHHVLNAKQHEREAHIVAVAGRQNVDKRGRTVGAITIATNMAGRGTDIKLLPAVREAGGLHIVGTERHESRRIDNQLRGRAGRQGDPGSSRFFISMEDDLMKMFAGKATMRALTVLGMKEDDAIEHKWITKSVERAQRKVEERNFTIRKNLLEYDEVMEYQRNTFYGTRQKVLEGEAIRGLVFDYIADATADATATYLDPMYVPRQVSEAVKSIMNVTIDPRKLIGKSVEDVEPTIRSFAKSDVRQDIEINVGEYMSHDILVEDWDLPGLKQWAASRMGVEIPMNQLKEMDPRQVMDLLTEHAHEGLERKPLSALEEYFDPTYAQQQLATWARNKFGLELTVEELSFKRGEKPTEAMERVADLIYQRAQQAYDRREVEYPIAFTLEMVFGTARQGAEASAWAADHLAKWANQRFELSWDPQTVLTMNGEQIHRTLVEAAEAWQGPKLDAWVSAVVKAGDTAKMAEMFGQRWGMPIDAASLKDDAASKLRRAALDVMRTELTQLERYVLLQILDQSWKDHLYAMDQLKDSVGLRGFAEKDPKIEYKAEGSRMFQQMLSGVRDKVTDLIFKARLTAQVQMRSVYQNQQAQHEVVESTGVNAAASIAGSAEQEADLAAAQQAGSGGEKPAVQQIVNDGSNVGRNELCPCGSGKKYKKCCGTAA